MNEDTTDVGRLHSSSHDTGFPTEKFDQSDGRGTLATGRLNVRCPSCHSPIDIAVDTALTDLTCSLCGSHFSLVDQSKATQVAPSLAKLGRFELIERLGIGGYGSVWKARDNELDRTVAIKIPRAGCMTSEEQEKFFREARQAAQLRHPNIVSVHEVGRDGDSIYIVSDFVRGVTLADWLTGQQITSREAAALCVSIANALHHAHEQGVVHRDLKPANIMLDGDCQPHLMDFGLARREVGEITVTLDGHVLGTPAYMSPEQAEGKGHQADRRSDVYSLGVIVFQLLTGELPFRGNARMLMHQVIHDEPPSPRKLNSYISKDIETITLKCLEKDVDKRYSSALEVANEFNRWLAGKPIHARPISWLGRVGRWAAREPLVATFGFVILALLLVVAAGTSYAALILRRQVQHEAYLRDQAQQSSQAAMRATSESDRMNRLLLSALHWGNQHPGATARESLVGAISEISTDVDGKSASDISLNQMIGQLYLDLGMLTEAETHLTKALNTMNRAGAARAVKWRLLHSLGWLRHRQNRVDEARQLLDEALALAHELDNPYPLGTGRLVAESAVVLERCGDDGIRQAEELLKVAETHYRDFLPESRGDLCHVLTMIGSRLMQSKAYAQSIEVMMETVNMSGSDVLPQTHLPYCYMNLSKSLSATGRLDEAILYQKKAVDAFAALFGSDNDLTRNARDTYQQMRSRANTPSP